MGEASPIANALPDHPLKKNEILDIFYNGLTDASRDFLDSCAGCVFKEQTIGQAEELLNNLLKNYDDWILPEPPLKPTPKKRGILYLSPEDMQEAKKSMNARMQMIISLLLHLSLLMIRIMNSLSTQS